ncbi:MAG: helix-turn-helix domain-containing protein [Duncaniella sp.]|nr:helix-turn-helix domain-containing protein [Muribaculum sp.]MCM1255809.1 helix-turn-helix domain-containing protein [Duncaniella sp.]
MRFLLTVHVILWSLLSIAQIRVKPYSESGTEEMISIDMRHGLSESRIRAFCPLPDGRMAIATAAYINIFDGNSFFSMRIENSKGLLLRSSGKARQMSRDSIGNIWLKMPATQLEPVETLHIYDPVSLEDVTMQVLPPEIKENIFDIYVDDSQHVWMIDTLFILNKFQDGVGIPIADIGSISSELPYAIYNKDDYLFLCYEDANVCVISLSTGMLVYKGPPNLPKIKFLQTNAGAKWGNSKLFTSLHCSSKREKIFISSLDTVKWTWETIAIDKVIHDYLVTEKGEIIYEFDGVDDEIFRIALDQDSGLWIGTKRNGIRYGNSSRQHIVKMDSSSYPYSLSKNYISPRAADLGHKLAPGGVNCSAVDSLNHYLYLGTSNGLMILDSADHIVALLAKNIGLPSNGVQSVIVVPYSGSLKNDSTASINEVWFTTATSLSRMRHTGSDRFEVLTLGILDGLNLNGSELYSQALVRDSMGRIITGYSGGTIIVNPTYISDENHVIYRYPSERFSRFNDEYNSHLHIYLIIIVSCIVVVVLAVCLSRRKKVTLSKLNDDASANSEGPLDTPSYNDNPYPNADIERKCESMLAKYNEDSLSKSRKVAAADKEFVDRVNKIIINHLGDEKLSVVTLSQDMAMDRTNLYRKMQTIHGRSPSVYIKEMRLSAAAKLLKETEIPIPDIAIQTGFSSAKYFSASFKEAFGLLPNKYRQSNKQS